MWRLLTQEEDIYISQWKRVLDILKAASMSKIKQVDPPMDHNVKQSYISLASKCDLRLEPSSFSVSAYPSNPVSLYLQCAS